MRIITFGAGGMSEAFEGTKITKDECDVRDYGAVWCAMTMHWPQVVIMTAGVSNPGRVEDTSCDEEITTNLIGAFNVAKAAIQCHVDTMIFIASVAGLHGKPNHSSYSTSKAGVISLVQSLGHEGHNAYAISPGRVSTKMRIKDYPNDTVGSRLEPERIWTVIEHILAGDYEPGQNILIRKVGLSDIYEHVVETPYREILRVGEPITI